jgi:gem associated protein 7
MADSIAKESSTSSNINGENEADETSIQQSRVFLRERFLRALFAVSNKPCTFRMYEKTLVNATFRSTDIEATAFQVSNLVTPMGVLPEALIRASDVLTITVATKSEEQFGTAY